MEDVFYVDSRNSQMIDLSKEIKEWATGKQLGSFHTSTMETTTMSSLNIRVGRPYVYQHMGNCEHIIMFSDIRLLDSKDPTRRSDFPKIHGLGRNYGKHCMMCSDFYAK